MTHEKFVMLVKEMRDRQKEYFKTRDKQVLTNSKAKEREVDTYVDDYIKPIVEAEERKLKERGV